MRKRLFFDLQVSGRPTSGNWAESGVEADAWLIGVASCSKRGEWRAFRCRRGGRGARKSSRDIIPCFKSSHFHFCVGLPRPIGKPIGCAPPEFRRLGSKILKGTRLTLRPLKQSWKLWHSRRFGIGGVVQRRRPLLGAIEQIEFGPLDFGHLHLRTLRS